MRPMSEVILSLRYVFVIAVFSALIYFCYTYRADLLYSIKNHYPVFGLLIVLSLLHLLGLAKNFMLIIGFKGAYVSVLNMWSLSSLLNYLGPFQPGLAVRAVYFKKNNISVPQVFLATARQIHINVWMGIGVSAFFLMFSEAGYAKLQICLASIFLLWPIFLHFLSKAIGHIQIWRKFSLEDLLLFKLSCTWIPLLLYALVAFMFFITYLSYEADIGFAEVSVLSVVTKLSGIAPITPGNLGVQEAIIVLTKQLSGLSTGDVCGIAFLIRVSHMLACVFMYFFTLVCIRVIAAKER